MTTKGKHLEITVHGDDEGNYFHLKDKGFDETFCENAKYIGYEVTIHAMVDEHGEVVEYIGMETDGKKYRLVKVESEDENDDEDDNV